MDFSPRIIGLSQKISTDRLYSSSVVTVPRFTQRPLSYLSVPTLTKEPLNFTVEIVFTPEMADGLIFYNDQFTNGSVGDFISFGMSNGFAEFRLVAITQFCSGLSIACRWHQKKVIKVAHRKEESVRTELKGTEVNGPFAGGANFIHQSYTAVSLKQFNPKSCLAHCYRDV